MAMEAPYLVFDFNTSFILKKKGLYNLAKTWHDGKAEGPNIYDFGAPWVRMASDFYITF